MTRIYVGDDVYEDPEWHCEAYGPLGRSVGALCFIAGSLGMRCASADVCHEYMQQERERIYHLIQDGARNGDQTMAYLAAQFKSPDELLKTECNSPHPCKPD